MIQTTPRRENLLSGAWFLVLRRYLVVVALGNLVWETLHLPLYTLWTQGSTGEKAFAVLHCTGGDLLIALSSLVLALVLAGDGAWPSRNFYKVAALATLLGVAYTVFSEKLNIVVRKSWAYSELMPVLPIIDVGLSPVMQWLVIPVAALAWSRRRARLTINHSRIMQ